jgi:hypothetical protein
MTTKLILVEGLPGSGKTTMAEFIRDGLAQRGQAPRLYPEGDLDHPADYESVACLSAAEYASVLEAFPECRERLRAQVETRGDEQFVGYRKLAQLAGPAWPEALLNRLRAHEIYEQPPEKFRRLLAARWQAFADRAAGENNVYIFECCFLQNPLTMLLGRHAEPVGAAQAFVLQLAQIVRPLQPALIYLDAGRVRPTLKRVAKTRPPEWLEFVIGYHTQQGHGQAHGWKGFDGLVKFYEMRQAIEVDLLPRLPWPHTRVPHSDWAADQQQVTAFLESRE